MAAKTKVKVSCINCGATNNFPLSVRGKSVVCGRCKETLPTPGTVIEPQSNQAYVLFQKSAIPVLVDFYSTASISSELMHSYIMNLAERRKGELMAVRINVEVHPQMAAAFRIQETPTFIILHRGNERARYVGEMSETEFSLWVAKLT